MTVSPNVETSCKNKDVPHEASSYEVEPHLRSGNGVVYNPLWRRLRLLPQSPAQLCVAQAATYIIKHAERRVGGWSSLRLEMCHGGDEWLQEVQAVICLESFVSEVTR